MLSTRVTLPIEEKTEGMTWSHPPTQISQVFPGVKEYLSLMSASVGLQVGPDTMDALAVPLGVVPVTGGGCLEEIKQEYQQARGKP